jgi:NAD-dependent deacetylase
VSIEHARGLIQNATSIAVLTGAGISAEGGIPTFRGPAGLWKQFRPEDLATPQAFRRDPSLVWEWYDWRRGLIDKAAPNGGHVALANLERRTQNFALVTQNVDGLHQKAGSHSVIEVHGSIWNLRCTKCERSWADRSVPLRLVPHCQCGALARPGVVWFGEQLPHDAWLAAEKAALSCEVFLVVGTSAAVYPAAGLVDIARSAGAEVIEVNVDRTAISHTVDHSIIEPAGEILPKLVASTQGSAT